MVDCQSTESSGLEDFSEQVWQVLSERGQPRENVGLVTHPPLICLRLKAAADDARKQEASINSPSTTKPAALQLGPAATAR